MEPYVFENGNRELFAAYHAIYADADITCHDWNERKENIGDKGDCCFVYKDGELIGGFTVAEDHIGSPFIVAPFSDRALFWRVALPYIQQTVGKSEIYFDKIPKPDADALASHGARRKWSTQRMCRPTNRYEPVSVDGYTCKTPDTGDLPQIMEVVYRAHREGYTSKIYGEPKKADTVEAIQRRYDSFARTNTWNFSVVMLRAGTNEIAGACIAGVYPDSMETPGKFATIHQVSVLPEDRKRGLAKAMMLRSISAAHLVSPVITLGVLIGNPAERLYRQLGFIPGPSVTNMVYCI